MNLALHRLKAARLLGTTAILVAGSWLCASAASAADAPPRPNILLIVSDDHGYRDLGCCGSADAKTPHLDRLASQGARLTNFYVAWPACTPSRASLLTGRYPQRNGVYDMMRNDTVDFGHRYTPAEYAVSPEMILGADLREVFLSEALQEKGTFAGASANGTWDSCAAICPCNRALTTSMGSPTRELTTSRTSATASLPCGAAMT
jgi:hypothetical protein